MNNKKSPIGSILSFILFIGFFQLFFVNGSSGFTVFNIVPIIFFMMLLTYIFKMLARQSKNTYSKDNDIKNYDTPRMNFDEKSKKTYECEYCGHINNSSNEYCESCGAQRLPTDQY